MLEHVQLSTVHATAEYLAYRAIIAARRNSGTLADSLESKLAQLPSRVIDRGTITYAKALVAAQRERPDRALDLFARSLQEGMPTEAVSFHYDLTLAPIWSSERFTRLLRPLD